MMENDVHHMMQKLTRIMNLKYVALIWTTHDIIILCWFKLLFMHKETHKHTIYKKKQQNKNKLKFTARTWNRMADRDLQYRFHEIRAKHAKVKLRMNFSVAPNRLIYLYEIVKEN